MPAESPSTTALMVVELQDVSYVDGPACVVASTCLPNTAVASGRPCPFEFTAPETPLSTALSIRCHGDISGDGAVTKGDLLSTESMPVPAMGDVDALRVSLTSSTAMAENGGETSSPDLGDDAVTLSLVVW
jgi:hypothetical protein